MRVILKQTIEAYKITRVDGGDIYYDVIGVGILSSSFQSDFIDWHKPEVGDYLVQELPSKRWRVEQESMFKLLYSVTSPPPVIMRERGDLVDPKTGGMKPLPPLPEAEVMCGVHEPQVAFRVQEYEAEGDGYTMYRVETNQNDVPGVVRGWWSLAQRYMFGNDTSVFIKLDDAIKACKRAMEKQRGNLKPAENRTVWKEDL